MNSKKEKKNMKIKVEFYITEMPLALVSPHLRCLKHHVFVFCVFFLLYSIKKKQIKEKNTIKEALPLFDYTDRLQ